MTDRIDQTVLEAEAELVNFIEEQRYTIINPNPGLLYEDTIGGRDYQFPPFKKFNFPGEQANFLVQRAAERLEMARVQAERERTYYSRCISSGDFVTKDMAKDFCSIEKGHEGEPNTKVWPMPGLVLWDLPAGREMVQRGVKFANDATKTEWTEYQRVYKKWLYEPGEKRPLTTAPMLHQPAVDTDMPAPVVNEVTLDVPKKDWELEQFHGYIKKLTDKEVPDKNKGNRPWLLARAQEAFEATKKAWDTANVRYVLEE